MKPVVPGVNIAVLNVSDTRHWTPIRPVRRWRAYRQIWALCRVRAIEKDDAGAIEVLLRRWIADPSIDVVITTGGTGITGRDVTPEAFDRVLEKRSRVFGELFRMLSYQKIGSRRSSLARWAAYPVGRIFLLCRQHCGGEGRLGRYSGQSVG